MQEYRFSLTRILPYKDRIYNGKVIQEIRDQKEKTIAKKLNSICFTVESMRFYISLNAHIF